MKITSLIKNIRIKEIVKMKYYNSNLNQIFIKKKII